MAMSSLKKSLTIGVWAALVVGMMGLIGAGLLAKRADAPAASPDALKAAPERQQEPLPVYFEAPAFELINQDNQVVRSDELRGKVWVAAFIFTRCTGPCPMMTGQLAKLQKAVTDPRIKLVSFSVDPERDTPEVLKQYAERLQADHERWYFLTGSIEAIDAASAGFKLGLWRGDGPDQITHAQQFLLVDGRGQVRGIYSSGLEEEMQRLMRDATRLAAALEQ
jgi:protein SCO1/2